LCRAFAYKDNIKPPRSYASILGCLLRRNFPGIVKLPSGGRSVAWSWEHYRYAKKPSNEFRDMQEKVQLLFWVSSIHFSSFSNAFDNSSTNGFHPFLPLCMLAELLCHGEG
jgi:hypothetical protein